MVAEDEERERPRRSWPTVLYNPRFRRIIISVVVVLSVFIGLIVHAFWRPSVISPSFTATAHIPIVLTGLTIVSATAESDAIVTSSPHQSVTFGENSIRSIAGDEMAV